MFNGAWPAGSIDGAHLPLVLARALWLAALFSATGALSFRALEARTDAGRHAPVRAGLSFLAAASLVVAAGAWCLWVALQAAAIAGATSPADAMQALLPVFSRSEFGHIALAQVGLVLAGLATLRLGRLLPALCALAAVTLQAGHLHARAMDGWQSLLTAAVLLHLWAAAVWLGGLLPLRLVVRQAPLDAARAAVRRFSTRAMVCVTALALTALFQALRMFGGIPGLFGATYGWVAMVKAALFAALLAFAWRNRFRLAPKLGGPDPAAGRAALARSIAIETGVGVVVLLAAAVLTALPPGMHVQPVWPFSLRPRLPLSDADLLALVALAAAAVLLCGALRWRRYRLPALALAAVLMLLAVPRLGSAFEPATPTGFYHSETGFSAASIADGGAQFARHCAACHGGGLRLAARDGDLFWVLSAGTPGMPGFAATLDDDARWHLIDFLRARAAAASLPARAPDLELGCADGTSPALSDFRGNLVRLVFAAAAGGEVPSGVPVVTLPVPQDAATPPAAGGCLVSDPDARTAYGIATGLPTDTLAGADVLIDRGGMVRAVLRPGGGAAALADVLARIGAAPAAGRETAGRPAG
jgi:putative copper export protein/mono/diheme cytochrome c family protein